MSDKRTKKELLKVIKGLTELNEYLKNNADDSEQLRKKITELNDRILSKGERNEKLRYLISERDDTIEEVRRQKAEAHNRGDAAEAKYKKADEVWSNSVQVLETINHRLQRVIEAIVKDMSDPTRVARIERHQFKGD